MPIVSQLFAFQNSLIGKVLLLYLTFKLLVVQTGYTIPWTVYVIHSTKMSKQSGYSRSGLLATALWLGKHVQGLLSIIYTALD